MLVNFDSLKTFYNIILQKLKSSRSNWNQTDPTALDYIKNRPSEVTSDDIIDWMGESNVIIPLVSSSGIVYTTNDDKVLIL